jgi:hypothetical protein
MEEHPLEERALGRQQLLMCRLHLVRGVLLACELRWEDVQGALASPA